MYVAQSGRRLYIYNKNYRYKFFLKKNENELQRINVCSTER
nr:MAG TPA: hypothetical protein [Microviridae sp.]